MIKDNDDLEELLHKIEELIGSEDPTVSIQGKLMKNVAVPMLDHVVAQKQNLDDDQFYEVLCPFLPYVLGNLFGSYLMGLERKDANIPDNIASIGLKQIIIGAWAAGVEEGMANMSKRLDS